MSKLLYETDEFLKLEAYVHHDPDDYSPWEIDPNGNEKYPHVVHEAEHYALMEIRVEYFIDKKTGKVTYDSFEP